MATSAFPNPMLPSSPKSSDWAYFSRLFENYLKIIGATDEQKLPLLLNSLGHDGLSIFDGLPDPKSTYAEATAQLDKHFLKRTSLLLRRKRFYEARQLPNEPITDFACRLRRLAKECDFGTQLQAMLRDILVIGVRDDVLGERLLAEDASSLTFDTALSRGEAFERARVERTQATKDSTVCALHPTRKANEPQSQVRQPTKTAEGQSTPSARPIRRPGSNAAHKDGAASVRFQRRCCYRCGSEQHLANSPFCKARDATCRSCSKRGHFQSQCKSIRFVSSTDRDQHAVAADVCSTCDQHVADDDYGMRDCDASAVAGDMTSRNELSADVVDDFTLFTACSDSHDDNLLNRNVNINGTMLKCKIDTGADCNCLGIKSLPRDMSLQLKPTNVRIKTWGSFPLKVLGSCTCKVGYKDKLVSAVFYVVDSDSMPLLSYDLSKALGIIKELASVSACDQLSEILKLHEPVFTQEGKLLDYCHEIKIDQSAVPFAPPTRRVPPALLEKVKEELDRMVAADVIEPVSGPTTWCAPSVIAFKKDKKSLRVCADLRKLNKYVQRETYQMPTFEEIRSKVSGSTVFSILDCTNSYWQVPISANSQPLLNFSTPFGTFCYKRLCFGLNSAPEVFQKILANLLRDIPGCFQNKG
jgi:hypothetical protein